MHSQSNILTNFHRNFPTINRINSAAVKIQSEYRGYKARKTYKLRRIEEEKAAVQIQVAFRKYLEKRKL